MASQSESVGWNLKFEMVALNCRDINNLIFASVVVLDVDLKLKWWCLEALSQLSCQSPF